MTNRADAAFQKKKFMQRECNIATKLESIIFKAEKYGQFLMYQIT